MRTEFTPTSSSESPTIRQSAPWSMIRVLVPNIGCLDVMDGDYLLLKINERTARVVRVVRGSAYMSLITLSSKGCLARRDFRQRIVKIHAMQKGAYCFVGGTWVECALFIANKAIILSQDVSIRDYYYCST